MRREMILGFFGLFVGCTAQISGGDFGGMTDGTLDENGDLLLPGDKDVSTSPLEGEKRDGFGGVNDPARFSQNLNYRIAELPLSGASEKVAWASTYWPTYEDSTNVRWLGRDVLSPLEKYDAAFNFWTPTPEFMTLKPFSSCNTAFDKDYYTKLGPAAYWMSENKGNKKMRDGVDSDNDGQVDECGDHDGVETWWGLCHAWVPAAILEPEPLKPVTYNNQRFEVSDIQALLITAYDKTNAQMLGGRCNAKEVERDENGRPKAGECRDTNAGAFHVVITNMLGLQKRAIAEDRTYDYQVWNQPLVGYNITMLEERTAAETNSLLGVSGASYPYNPHAKRFFEVKLTTDYITESYPSVDPTTPIIGQYTEHDSYHYIVEIDDRDKIIGGEWIGSSNTDHPDFLWMPVRALGGNPKVDLLKVRTLLELSRKEDAPAPASGDSFSSTQIKEIPDNSEAGIESSVTINEDITIGGLSVAVDIEHSYSGDLVVELRRDGQSVTLHSRAGGSTDNLAQTFAVSEFNNQNARGTWRLFVRDAAPQDTGRIRSFSVTVVRAAITAPTGGSFTSSIVSAIPDNNATGVQSPIDVSAQGNVSSLVVTVDIEHTYIADLVVTLTHNNTTVTLHNNEGDDADNIKRTFTVTDFNGQSMSGAWTLSVKDTASQDTGSLKSWGLSINQ